MKKIAMLLMAVIGSVMAVMAGENGQDVWHAMSYGAEFLVHFKVVDERGTPIEGVSFEGWKYLEYDKEHGERYSYITDKDGCVSVRGFCGEWFSAVVRKFGYYTSSYEIKYPNRAIAKSLVNGKWQPYGETRTVVLKKIKNPIEMVKAPRRINKAISFGDWYGYDLVLNDWIVPYGKGEQSDVLVRLGFNAKNDTSDFCTTMDLCFTNNPYCGVYRKSKDIMSEFKSDYAADTNDVYKTEVSFKFERNPHQPMIDTRLDRDSYLVFRIRARVDEEGRLISAHYGKVYGLWSFFGAMNVGTLYFNPTPNDTNLEDAETARRSKMLYSQWQSERSSR